jgi:ATP synthase protein I
VAAALRELLGSGNVMDERSGIDQGLRVLSYLLSGPLLYGTLGALLDLWFHTSVWLAVGIVFGAAAGVYLVIKRFGRM